MFDSPSRLERDGRTAVAALALLCLTLATQCSSTTQTNVVAAGGDGGSTASSLPTGGSPASNGGTAGTGGAGGGTCTPALVPDLHASCIENLGQGVLRFHYDFASPDQALDWSAATDTTVNVTQKALVTTIGSGIGVAIFKRKLHVNKASFNVTLLSGNTTNWYINTIWDGSWNPLSGYGGYNDGTGRGFIINGTKNDPDDVSPLSVGIMHSVSVEQTDTELRWSQGGTTMTHAVAPLPVTDRVFAIGAWDSSAAFYDVVFEGTLNSP